MITVNPGMGELEFAREVTQLREEVKVNWQGVRRGLRLGVKKRRSGETFALKRMPGDEIEGRRNSSEGPERE